MNERTLFLAALAITDPAARADYLAKECANDTALRQRVEALLKAHDEAGSLLEKPAADAGATGAYTRPADDDAKGNKEIGQPNPQNSTAEGPGTRIGPYKLLQVIGEGGMGVVYMAEQQEPVRRMVALKIIKAGMDSKEVVARFDAERQALAVMDHQNIAKVFDAGATSSGRLYFVMELVKGTPITKYCDEHRLTPRERLDLFMPVCHALQHAHQKGIIHRDIKPSNVLVAPYDGKPVVKVIDFGIAKATGQQLTERTMFTEFGAVLGTLEYMSPEQAELNNQDIDTRSDIYSLGVLLYELLTGTTPLDRSRLKKAAFTEMLRIIREEEPPRPSMRLSGSNELPSISAQRQTEPAKLSKLMRGDLDWIVMKSLDKDRARRYETANGLARDIERHLKDEAVEACPPSARYRFRKLMRRYKTPLRVAAALFLVLVTGVIVSSWLAVVALQAEEAANLARDAEKERAGELGVALRKTEAAEQAEKERAQELQSALVNAESHLNNGRILLAENAWNLSGVVDHANKYIGLVPPYFRNWEWGYLKRKYDGGLFKLRGHAGPVQSVAFNWDGSRIASGSWDNTVRVWDARSGQLLVELKGHADRVMSVAFSPDGNRIASGSFDKSVRVWEAKTGKPLLELNGHARVIFGVAFSPDGHRIVSGSVDKTVRIWDANNGQPISVLKGHSEIVSGVAFSADGSRIASASLDKTVRIWDAKTDKGVLAVHVHAKDAWSVAFSPDGKHLASAAGGSLYLWELGSGQPVWTRDGHIYSCYSIAFSPDCSRIATGSADQTVRIWDAKNGQELFVLKGHTLNVRSVAFSSDGSLVASGSDDKTVRVWDARTGLTTPQLKGHTQAGLSLAFSPDGSQVVTGSFDKTVRVWDAKSGQTILRLKGHTREVRGVAFSPDGNAIASASADKTVRVWDARTGNALLELSGHSGEVLSVGFSPDSNRIVSGSNDKTVRVWDAKSGQTLMDVKGHTAEVRFVAFSPDGTAIASASVDKTVRLWDTKNGKTFLELTGWSSLAFSPDGSRIASNAPDNYAVRIWDTKTGELALELTGHTGLVEGLAFSPDGSRVASGSLDKSLRVWDAKSGQALVELKGHLDSVRCVAFSPDGKRIFSGSNENPSWSADKAVRIWDGTTPKTELDEDERLSRLWLTRPDPQWHIEKRLEAEKENNTFAAAFHRSWEQHARGVLALEAGDFNMAFAHFVAAAALKPKVPPVPK